MSKTYRVPILLALLALTVCMGSLQAGALTASPSTGITVTCNTATGPAAPVTVTIKLSAAYTAGTTITATPATGALTMVTPTTVLKALTDSAVFSFSVAPGCVGATTPQTITFSTTVAGATSGSTSVAVPVTITVTSTVSGLSTPSNSVTVTCVKNSSTVYTAGVAQSLALTSTATGGTPFTVSSSPALPDWLTVTPASGTATATSTALKFTPVAIAGSTACASLAAKGTTSFSVKLTNTPGPDKIITVTLQVFAPSPLTASPSPANLTYVKGSGAAGRADVSVTSSLSTPSFFSVDTSSLPIWLTVDSVTGLTPKMPRFSTTGIADTLAPGTYKATVTLQVSGFGDLLLPFSLLVTNPTPKFSIQEGLTRTLSWKPGDAPPTATITAVSTGSAIPYSITTSGTLAPIIQPSFLNGLAYSFGTGIPVTFDPLTFAAAQPGSTLTGTVTFTWGSPASTTVVTIAVNITSSAATLTSIAPASLPTSAAGQSFYVTLVGSGFVPSLDPAQKTKVGVVASPGAPVVSNTNISWTVVDTAKISLTITVPALADAALPFAVDKTGGPVTIGVCNPTALTGTCTVPTGTVTLTIGNSPIIQAVTSASAFIQVSAPSQTVAPYDIVSIFGTNFCTSGGTGCSSTQVLAGTPDTVTKTLAYPTWLSPDDEKVGGNPNPKRRLLTVTFQTHATPAVVIGNAPLLFATNNQINVMAPAALKNYYDQQVDIVVSFGYGSVPATLLSSGAYGVTVKNASPGIFTVGSDGQGDGAILNSNWALVGATQPAGMRASSTDSDSVQIYMTGLGEPASTAANTANSSPAAWSTDCVSIDNYKASLIANTASVATLDGVVINSAWLAKNRFQPCIPSNAGVAVTIGGQPATVLYAGWVQDSIAGLYQVNAQLPSLTPTTANSSKFTTVAGANVSAIADNVQLPVKVTMNGQTSQDGVSIWVAPRLKVTAPATLSGTVGTQWATTNNALTTSGGTAPYRYAVTSGLLPSGLSLSSTLGAITGYPAANTNGQYLITVTATDSSQIPVTGSATFTLTIGSGLMLSSTAILPSYPFGVAAAITTVSATGGVWPYKYTTTALAGLTVNVDTGAVAIDATLRAGTYTVTVLATDSATPPVTGSITFDIVVGLVLTPGSITSPTSVTGGAITTFTTTGNTGVVTYAVDTTNAGLGFQMTGAVLSLGASNTAAAGTYAVIVTATDPTQATGASAAGTGKFTVNVTVGAAAQTISFTAPSATATFSQLIAPITLVGSSSSTLPITYTVSGPATVSGSTLTITGAGIVSVTASQAGNAFYAAATPVTYTITVAKGTQTITFAATASGAINSSMTLAATSDSGLAVSYTYAAGTGSATLSGSTLTLTGQGTFTITASQPGNANYNAATPVVQTITVTP